MNRSTKLGLALAGILLLALVLRLWGIGFGLPYAYHIDEPTYVSAALNLAVAIIGRQPNPTGFSNLLLGEYMAYFVVGRLTGLFASASNFEQTYRSDPSMFLLLGRLTSALLGTLSVLVVYQVGKVSSRRLQGLLAALLLAVAFLHVRDSHYGVPDVAAGCLVSVTALFCLLAVKQPTRRYLYLAAVMGGLAVAVKWSVWPVLITLALATFLSGQALRERAGGGQLVQHLFVAFLCFVGGLVVGGFQLFLKPMIYLEYALREAVAGEGGGFGIWQIDAVPGWLFYLKTGVYGLGLGFLALAAIGGGWRLVQAIRYRDRQSMVFLSFPVCYYLIMGATRHYFARYALPLVPFAAVFAAEAILLSTRLKSRGAHLGKGVAVLLAVVAVVQPLAWSVQHDWLLVTPDTRTLAKSWIEANLPAGAKIAVDWPVHGPPLSTSGQVMPGSDKVYDVVVMGDGGLADHTLQWYRQQDIEYLITSSFISDLATVNPKLDFARHRFYASLDQDLTLLQVFYPYLGSTPPPFIFDEIYGPAVSVWVRARPGPILKVYKIHSP